MLHAIKSQSRTNGFLTGFSMGFFIYFAKERQNKLLLLPALGIMIAGKYYGDNKRNQEIKECQLEEYVTKSSGLENHLRYLEIEVENYDKLRSI